MTDQDSWNTWSKHVLAELERQTTWVAEIQRSVNRVEMEIAVLKYKSSLWGATAGAISVAVMLGLSWAFGRR